MNGLPMQRVAFLGSSVTTAPAALIRLATVSLLDVSPTKKQLKPALNRGSVAVRDFVAPEKV